MRLLLFWLLTLSATINTAAQKDFEGIIRYTASPEESSFDSNDSNDHPKKDSVKITIAFIPGKILIRTDKGGNMSEENILILIDSAKVYTLNKYNKTYRVKRLLTNRPMEPAVKEIIAGYSGSPLQVNNNLQMMLGANATLWFADSLFFHVPAKYEGNEELLMVNNNRILLKAIIKINDYPRYNQSEEEDTIPADNSKEISLIVSEVIHGNINPSDFVIPAGYTTSTPAVDTFVTMPDSTAWIADTILVKPAPEKKPAASQKAPAKKPVKPVTNTKSSLRKQD